MKLLRRNKWMAEHRRLLITAAAALAVFAILGGVYCTGWLWGPGGVGYRSHFKIIPAEHLEYSATSWLGEAGTITVDVSPLKEHDDGSGSYRIVYTLATSPKVSAIYIMKGQVTALIDAKTLLPIEFEEKMRTGLAITGGDDKHKKLVYDRAKNEVRYYKHSKKSKKGELRFKGARKIPPNSHHYTSLLYYIRFVNFEPGKEISVLMSDRKRDVNVKASVLNEKDYEAPDGTIRKAIVLKTITDFGKEDIKGSTFHIWLDKEERYPVRMKVKLKWGTVRATLLKRTIKNAPST